MAEATLIEAEEVVAVGCLTGAERIADRSGQLKQPTPARAEVPAWAAANPGARGGMLDSAFAVLDTLARDQDGLVLTELAEGSRLTEISAFRLAEELVALGAVRRDGDRYYIGARMGRFGKQWQPHPVLAKVAAAPVGALAVQSRAMAALRVLHNDKLWVVAASVPPRFACMPTPIGRDSIGRTATGRVLYAADDITGIALLPGCSTPRKWRQTRKSLRDLHAVVVEEEEAFPGICCVAAPVWWPDGSCAAALTALVAGSTTPPRLADLVSHIAGGITAALRQSTDGSAEPARLQCASGGRLANSKA